MANDSIAKLRAYIDNHLYDYDVGSALWVDISEILNEIVDEIEAQYMKLPTDADGVPIKVDEMMPIAPDNYVRVVAVDRERWFYFNFDDNSYHAMWARKTSHEMRDAIIDLLEGYSNLLITSTNHKSLREEYAKRIREVVTNG